jgi:hypothetical protein
MEPLHRPWLVPGVRTSFWIYGPPGFPPPSVPGITVPSTSTVHHGHAAKPRSHASRLA